MNAKIDLRRIGLESLAWISAFMAGINVAMVYPNPAYDAGAWKAVAATLIYLACIAGIRKVSP